MKLRKIRRESTYTESDHSAYGRKETSENEDLKIFMSVLTNESVSVST